MTIRDSNKRPSQRCKIITSLVLHANKTAAVPARATHRSTDKTMSKGCSLFSNMFTWKNDILESEKRRDQCLPNFGMNWSDPSSVSWSSVRMSTMFGLEFGSGLGRLPIAKEFGFAMD